MQERTCPVLASLMAQVLFIYDPLDGFTWLNEGNFTVFCESGAITLVVIIIEPWNAFTTFFQIPSLYWVPFIFLNFVDESIWNCSFVPELLQ